MDAVLQTLQNDLRWECSGSTSRYFRERSIHIIDLSYTDSARARNLVASLLTDARRLPHPLGVAWARCAQAAVHCAVSDFADAFPALNDALQTALAHEERRLVAYCYHYLGACHFHSSDYPSSLEFSYQALHLRRPLGNAAELMQSIGAIGAIQGRLGNLQEAAQCFTEALQIARRTDNLLGQAINLSNMGLLLLKIDPLNSESVPYLQESVALAESLGESKLLANTLTHLSEALVQQGQLEQAEQYSAAAIHRAESISAPAIRVRAILQLATVYIKQQNWTNAVPFLKQAEAFAAARGVTEVLTLLPKTWGEYRSARGEWTQAYECFLCARNLAQQLGEKETAAAIELALAETSEAAEQYQQALQHFRAYHDQQVALDKQSARHLLLVAQAKATVEKAETEAEMARKEAEIARLRSVELAEANRQKDRLLQQLQLQANRLARQAIEDPLTGLYNRRYLTEYLQGELHRTRDQHRRMTVVIADIDNFKLVNDRFSHAIGDEVLKATAEIMRLSCRPSDVVSRYGGEEFILVLPDTSAYGAVIVCERLRQSIEGYDWSRFHPDLAVTISMGIVDEAAETTEEMIAIADRRLYQAKHDGKNRTVCSMNERLTTLTPPDALPYSID